MTAMRTPPSDDDDLPLPPSLQPVMEGEGVDTPRLLSFTIGDSLAACPLDHVREIVAASPTTRLPGAPPCVLGIFNLRGTLLTVLDVQTAVLPDAPPPAPPDSGHVLVIEVDGRVVGCRVTATRRVHPMPSLQPPQASGGNGMPPGIVLGYGEAGDRLVAVLDLPALARQTLLFPGER